MIEDLDSAIRAVCPILGVAIIDPDNKATWRIDFAGDAGPSQRAAALAVMAAFDLSAPTLGDYRKGLQAMVDGAAKSRGYDNGVSCAGYAASSVPAWAAEAAAFVAWRDAVWTYAFAELEKVQNGQRTKPSVSQLIDETPKIQWPG